MRSVPINGAEAVIEAFWDESLSDLAEYLFEPGPKTGASVRQYWCWVDCIWNDAVVGQPVFTMSRDVDIAIENYDAMRIRCGVSHATKLFLDVVIDGREQRVIDGVVGPDREWEFTGPIRGSLLEKIVIRYEAIEPGSGGGTMQYINLVDTVMEERLRARSCPYRPDWPKFLEPSAHSVDFKPGLGILFDGEDLERIRRNVEHPAYRPLMDSLRAKAREHLSAQPERFVMESGATINRISRAHEIAAGESDPANMAVVCGFVGLVDRDADLLRMAARAMLAMAYAEYWDHNFQEHFPGSGFDQRAFMASDNAYSSALGLDWAGAMLTQAGRRIVLEAISKKGMSLINKDFIQYEYIYSMNQACVFSQGRIAGLLAMRSLWPRAEEWLPLAEKHLYESIDKVFNATEDHGGREGPGYVAATLSVALHCLVMLGRHHGRTLADVTPDELIGCSDFCFMFLSTADHAGSMIPYGDSGTSNALDTAALMGLASGQDRWERLRRAMVHARASVGVSANSHVPWLYTLIFTDPPTDGGGVDLPTFCLLPSTGMLESCRRTEHGAIRLQLTGAAEGAGHVHQDKGSVVIEAYGDALAIDRGILNYGHPACHVAKLAHMHNVLSPAQVGDRPARQKEDVDVPILPRGKGDEQTLTAAVDTTPIWDGQFKKHVRRIWSPQPMVFFFDDFVEFEKPCGATFHLHSRYPIERISGGFVIKGEHAHLTITSFWTPVDAACGPDFVDAKENPVNHLALTSQPGTSYHLVTLLSVSTADDTETWRVAPSGETGTFVAQCGKQRQVFRVDDHLD